MSDKRRVGLVLFFAAMFFISACFPFYYTSRLWIGYETYKASIVGPYDVSFGYTLYQISPIVNAFSSLGIIAALAKR